MTYRRLIRFSASTAIALLFTACGSNDGPRECLGGTTACGGAAVATQSASITTESSSGTVTASTAAFSCTATASPSQVLPGQTVGVQVNVTGATGNLSIAGYVNSFANSVSLYGSYNSDKAGTVVSRTVQVTNSAGVSASCNFQVQVLGTSNSGLSCNIGVAQSTLKPGDTANFTFSAVNTTNGSATFSHFYPSQNWGVLDSLLSTTSSTSAAIAVRYDFTGIKLASVLVTSGNQQAFCLRELNVGGAGLVVDASTSTTALNGRVDLVARLAGYTNLSGITYGFSSSDSQTQVVMTGSNTASVFSSSVGYHQTNITVTAVGSGINLSQVKTLIFTPTPGSTPIAACNVLTAPLAFPQQTSAASIQGTVTRVRAFAQSGVGPFQVSLRSVTQNGANFPHDIFSDSRTGTQQINIRLRKPGNPLVAIRLDDLGTGTSAYCSTYHVSSPSHTFVVGADTAQLGAVPGPIVKVFQGPSATMREYFYAFESTFTGGVRVASGDFDGDGIVDYVAGRGFATNAITPIGFRIYKGNDTFYYSGKAQPTLISTIEPVFSASQSNGILVAAGDVNGDGKADVVAGNTCDMPSPRVKIYSGGKVLIADFQPYSGVGGARVAVGDLNKDGYSDVVVSSCAPSTSGIIYTFSGKTIWQNYLAYGSAVRPSDMLNPIQPFSGLIWESKIAVGDYNGDGYADIATAYNGSLPGTVSGRTIKVYGGSTGGILTAINPFTAALDVAAPTSAWSIAMTDLDGDGISEILLGGNKNGATPEVRIFNSQIFTPSGYWLWFQPILNFVGSVFVGAGTGSI